MNLVTLNNINDLKWGTARFIRSNFTRKLNATIEARVKPTPIDFQLTDTRRRVE